ncbi:MULTISPECIES: hypothetical protein [unclassified Acinetobacter]|nr:MULTISPECIES: hypothetical protein [unclassified Acinetobacter]MDH0030471.1 hypothetical protein [Acinetobacter sp. GD04021]MDH0885640.1 hypothetical protein [Acinetobacter sp. GD03873]MDH1082044.1 hypothetical protein [Acinetobacter sp. GD03983]MDH2188926.1 hypothetical protein [Acinetobacter sp. GD03645]MDH2202513.1 hypothetical protein [Acinetobacter sp. GD03647]
MSEYAPQYTFKERVKIIALHSLWVLPILFLFISILYWIESIIFWAACFPFGYEILFYGVMVVFPLIASTVLLFIWWRDCFPVFLFKQYPAPHKKTIRKIKYYYGKWAVFMAVMRFIHASFLLLPAIFGIWYLDIMFNLPDSENWMKMSKAVCSVSS